MPTFRFLEEAELREIGDVFVDIELENAYDADCARTGNLDPARIRRTRIEHALIDQRATHVCLPREAIDHLGLTHLRNVDVRTRDGLRSTAVDCKSTIDAQH